MNINNRSLATLSIMRTHKMCNWCYNFFQCMYSSNLGKNPEDGWGRKWGRSDDRGELLDIFFFTLHVYCKTCNIQIEYKKWDCIIIWEELGGVERLQNIQQSIKKEKKKKEETCNIIIWEELGGGGTFGEEEGVGVLIPFCFLFCF